MCMLLFTSQALYHLGTTRIFYTKLFILLQLVMAREPGEIYVHLRVTAYPTCLVFLRPAIGHTAINSGSMAANSANCLLCIFPLCSPVCPHPTPSPFSHPVHRVAINLATGSRHLATQPQRRLATIKPICPRLTRPCPGSTLRARRQMAQRAQRTRTTTEKKMTKLGYRRARSRPSYSSPSRTCARALWRQPGRPSTKASSTCPAKLRPWRNVTTCS
jgi:ferredoxin-like protein FixX